MRIIIDIALIVLFIGLVYFICSKTGKTDKQQRIILRDSMKTSASSNTDSGVFQQMHEDRQGGEESSKEEQKGKTENTISFSLVSSGESKSYSYKALNNLTKVPQSTSFSGYVTSFAADLKKINLSNENSFSHIFSILLPLDAGVGTYTEKSNAFIIQFFGPENGKLYTLQPEYSFTLTIHEWGGPGGRARGIFFGELKAADSSIPLVFRDGQFDIGIQQ